MSFLLGPALRRLFTPNSGTSKPGDKTSDDMDLQPRDAVRGDPIPGDDPIDALAAAVDRHEAVNEMERSSYDGRLRGTIDDLLRRMDKRAQDG